MGPKDLYSFHDGSVDSVVAGGGEIYEVAGSGAGVGVGLRVMVRGHGCACCGAAGSTCAAKTTGIPDTELVETGGTEEQYTEGADGWLCSGGAKMHTTGCTSHLPVT